MNRDKSNRAIAGALAWLVFSIFLHTPDIYAQDNFSGSESGKKILILMGPHYGIPTADIFLPAITDTLKKGGIQSDHIYTEFLDFFRFPHVRDGSEMVDLFTKKYRETHIDLIIPISQEAVDFVASELSNLFPGAPLLIPGFETEPAWASEKRPIITLPTELDIEGTLDLAITLFPSTERLVIISGDDEYSRLFLGAITGAAEGFPQFKELFHTAGLAYSEMLRFLATLPSDTIAIFGTYFIDSAGKSFVPAKVARQAAQQSVVPVFGVRDVHVENGLLGGSVIMSTKLGEQTAETALGFLSGEVMLNGTNITLKAEHFSLLDWQQLQRFNVETRKLPANTVFLNRPLSIWDQHKEAVIVALAGIVILFALVVALLIINVRLRVAIRERKQAQKLLKQQKTQLEQRNRALKQFNYAVSHELKTPLVSIESSLGLIQSTLPQTTDPELTSAFGYARTATRQMNNLLESLLLMFRIDAADTDTEATAFGVLVQDAIDQLIGGGKLEGIKVTITANGPELCGDRHKLVQIWQHLIGNAAKYMGDQKNPAIGIGFEQSAQEVLFYVRDNGMGIEQAYQGKIFGLFDRLDKNPDGTGLGLTLVKRIVEYYGGTIRVDSAGMGQGSCFYFTLPEVLIDKDTTT